MEANFAKALAWVRQSEGSNDDDPDDRGGRTSRGITQREYDAYCRISGLPTGDVWKAPDAIVDDIYHRSYWMPYSPQLPGGLDYMFFDQAVLSGPHEAIRELQEALDVTRDGHLGVVTSAALVKTVNDGGLVALLTKMAKERSDYDRQLVRIRPRNRKFLRGWLARVEFVHQNALTLVPEGHV